MEKTGRQNSPDSPGVTFGRRVLRYHGLILGAIGCISAATAALVAKNCCDGKENQPGIAVQSSTDNPEDVVRFVRERLHD